MKPVTAFGVLGLAVLAIAAPVVASAPHGRATHAKTQPRETGHTQAREATHAPAPASSHTGGLHWTYTGETGPDHWGDVSEDFKTCKLGHQQSPIDLGAADLHGRLDVRTAYKPGQLIMLNNGHTIQANIPEGSILSSGISRYKLLQIHFHTPSEETVYGIQYPMVAHFVHVDYSGNLAVLGVLFEEGARNPELDKIINAAPKEEAAAQPVAGVTFDPSRLLPAELSVYRYDGSLTTPPCSEGVRWHVAQARVTASTTQIAAIHAIIGDNARPIQPRNGRLLVAGSN